MEIVEKEEEKLEDAIHRALDHLLQYGITYKFLREQIDRKILDNAQG
jgi:hypothetical protein